MKNTSELSSDGKFVCLRCHQRCVVTAEKENGKIVRISDCPCIKGRTMPDVMYHPDRVLYPLKRVGERGEGKWQRISWDEATTAIASRLKEIIDSYGGHTIFLSDGSGQKNLGEQAISMGKKLFDTPNVHRGRYTCIIPQVTADYAALGDFLTYEFNPDYAHANCIVFWGSNPDVATPAQAREARASMRRGAKVIVMDPRPTPIAKDADLWLQLRPGTDTALGLAMLNVVINEELYDKEFVEKYCYGFDKLKQHVQEFTPKWAAPITRLSEENIIKAARMYATTKPACVYARCGSVSQQINSSNVARAMNSLIAICGNVDVQGGNLLYFRTWIDANMWAQYMLIPAALKPSPKSELKFAGAGKYPMMHFIGCAWMPDIVKGFYDGTIRACWCISDNLVVAEQDMERVWEGLKRVELSIVNEYFMTPTAELADFVLPAAFYTEIDNIVEAFQYPYNWIMAYRKIAEPLGECWDDRKIVIEVAKKMGTDVPWNDVEDFLNWRLKYLGVTFNDINKMPDHKLELPREFKRYERGVPAFPTPTGKFELYSNVFEALGTDPLPVFREPPESPVSTPELYKEFPLIYTHLRLTAFQHSEGRQIARQRNMIPDPYLEMHPGTASKLGIKDGDWVELETPKSAGKRHIKFKAKLVPGYFPDVVGGPHGWWFPEKPAPEHGCFDSNINALIPHEPPYEPTVGNPACRSILCRVRKAKIQS